MHTKRPSISLHVMNLTKMRRSIDNTFDENPILYAIGIGISVSVLILAYISLFAYYLAPRYTEWATGGRVTVPSDDSDDAVQTSRRTRRSRKVQFK